MHHYPRRLLQRLQLQAWLTALQQSIFQVPRICKFLLEYSAISFRNYALHSHGRKYPNGEQADEPRVDTSRHTLVAVGWNLFRGGLHEFPKIKRFD